MVYTVGLAILGVFLFSFGFFASGVAITDHLEQKDRFCIACHLHEQKYAHYTKAEAGTLLSLAGAHKKEEVKCIDCHIGATIEDKLFIKLIAAKDTVKFFTGFYEEPKELKHLLGDRTCLKCHTDSGQDPERKEAFHNLDSHRNMRFACSQCHLTHPEASPQTLFLQREIVQPICRDCHTEEEGSG
jgi:nitrate/TMAO reductase-like tetraheme cytochrome c subunit